MFGEHKEKYITVGPPGWPIIKKMYCITKFPIFLGPMGLVDEITIKFKIYFK